MKKIRKHLKESSKIINTGMEKVNRKEKEILNKKISIIVNKIDNLF